MDVGVAPQVFMAVFLPVSQWGRSLKENKPPQF
jgi:hypothetical protein